jgi:hypothetical protein
MFWIDYYNTITFNIFSNTKEINGAATEIITGVPVRGHKCLVEVLHSSILQGINSDRVHRRWYPTWAVRHIEEKLMSSDNEMTNLLLEWHANSFAEGIVATCEALIQTNIDQPEGTKEDFMQTVIGIRAAAKKSIVQQDSTIVDALVEELQRNRGEDSE